MDLLRVKTNFLVLVAVIFVFCAVHLSESQKRCKTTRKQIAFEGALGCQSDKLHLRCGHNNGGILIHEAFFGRPENSKICYNEARNMTQCKTKDVSSYVQSHCNGLKHCAFKVNSKTFGIKDFCPSVQKYVTVVYLCWKGRRDKIKMELKQHHKNGTARPTDEMDYTTPTTEACINTTDSTLKTTTKTTATTTPTKKATAPAKLKIDTTFTFFQQSSVMRVTQNIVLVTIVAIITALTCTYS